MNVTREVILDLLPLYFAGEASEGSRRLVEEFLAGDSEFAERVRALGAASFAPTAAAELPPELELESLRRTRTVLTTLRWLFGLGIAFTALGLAMRIRIEHGRIESFRFLVQDSPLGFGVLLVLGLGCLIGYSTLRKRLRYTAR